MLKIFKYFVFALVLNMTFVIVPPNIFGDIVGLDTTLINPIPDTDGDGLPDDYEVANSINPGGINVSLLTGTIASAHGETSGSEAANAIDGDPNTVWTAQSSGSPTFFEVFLPQDTDIVQVERIICVKG